MTTPLKVTVTALALAAAGTTAGFTLTHHPSGFEIADGGAAGRNESRPSLALPDGGLCPANVLRMCEFRRRILAYHPLSPLCARCVP